ncbi:MAG: hypothetical protein KGJ41_18125 [Rhodospirillales bacterium]|nr:hypothetical protein [Rhodospirillales bacterium]
MRGEQLADTVRRGLGRVADQIGGWCDVYRPMPTIPPLSRTNRILRLPAAFTPSGDSFTKAESYGAAEWWCVADAAYLRAGDYLVRAESREGAADGGVWFVAAIQPLLPVLCVRASRMLSFKRPAAAPAAGANGYGGVQATSLDLLLDAWPASVLAAGHNVGSGRVLPSDVASGQWVVLLPATPGVMLRSGDLVSDDLGRNGVVGAAEHTDLGWRLHVRQVTS